MRFKIEVQSEYLNPVGNGKRLLFLSINIKSSHLFSLIWYLFFYCYFFNYKIIFDFIFFGINSYLITSIIP